MRILTQLAAAGVGACVLPYSAVSSMVAQGALQARPVEGMSVDWTLLHARHVEPTPSVLALIQVIVDAASRASAEGRWPGMQLLTRELPPRR